MKFKENLPEEGRPVWVWLDDKWIMAALIKSMYPLHDERARMKWSFLNSEVRTALDDDIYVTISPPLPLTGG